MISQVTKVRSSIDICEQGQHSKSPNTNGMVHIYQEGPEGRPLKKRRLNVVIRPSDYCLAAFRANGVEVELVRKQAAFLQPKPKMVAEYTSKALEAVRKNDLASLKKMHEKGELTTNACNKWGDSLLHLACRRSHTEIAKWLLQQVMKVDDCALNIRDDFHRTPLHDATWTASPNFELVDLLIKKAPHHLVLQDVRGFTPMDYVRDEHWGLWLRFLWERKSLMETTPAISKEAALKRDQV